jgi:hypothetical protein
VLVESNGLHQTSGLAQETQGNIRGKECPERLRVRGMYIDMPVGAP